jgi:tRNA 2-thiocytidine biosynthesis protein TtcA
LQSPIPSTLVPETVQPPAGEVTPSSGPAASVRVTMPRSLREAEEERAAWLQDVPDDIRVPKRALVPDDPKNLERKISHLVTTACKDFNLLEDGDRVMVCMSGGKDSYALLHFMQRAMKHSPIRFEIVAVHLDQGHPGFPLATLENYIKSTGVPYEIVHQHTHDIVLSKLEPGKTTCSLCSRLRRGILYDTAKRLGCTKVALGHHRDDMLATLLLNLFFCGQLKGMPAILRADDGHNTVIRPLAYVPEPMLIKWAEIQQYPLIPCNLCSRQPDLKRAQMNGLIKELDERYPGALPSALQAMQSVNPRFLLDRDIYDFSQRVVDDDADAEAFE